MGRAAALADQTPDPQLAALIAVSVLTRSPTPATPTPRRLAHDGAILVGPYGGVLAAPPELRRFLATWQHERERQADGQALPLFAGNRHGRISQPTIRRRLARLDGPATLLGRPARHHDRRGPLELREPCHSTRARQQRMGRAMASTSMGSRYDLSVGH